MRSLPLLLVLVAACDYGFEKQSHIAKLRVLAVQAEPPEVVLEPGQSAPPVHLTALAIDPSGAPLSIEYALCDAVGLPDPAMDCPGAHGVPLSAAGPLSAQMDLAPYASQIAQQMPAGASSVPLVVGFNAVAGGEKLHGFATLNVRTSAGRPANRNPLLDRVEVDGVALSPEGTTTIRASTEVKLRPVPAVDAAEATDNGPERLVFSFYSTDGEMDALRTTNLSADGVALDPEVKWTAPKVAGTVQLWVVIRDGRGGVSWLARSLQVLPE
jgi:hypothetical protein